MLKQRVVTALIAVAALLLVLFALPQAAAQLVVAALILAGAWEWSGFLGTPSNALRALYVIFIAVLMALATWVVPDIEGLAFRVALVWWVCALVWMLFYPTPIPGIVRWIAGALVLLPLYEALIVLYLASPIILLSALLIVWAADTGAFVAGKLFGRVKLAPKAGDQRIQAGRPRPISASARCRDRLRRERVSASSPATLSSNRSLARSTSDSSAGLSIESFIANALPKPHAVCAQRESSVS